MDEHLVKLDQIAGRITIADPGVFRGAQLLVNGSPAERIKAGRFRLTRTDGSVTEAKFQVAFGQYLPTLVVDGVNYEVGPKLQKWLLALAFLPLCLVFGGGALGGLCGAVGWGFNNQLARSSKPAGVKVGLMLLVTAVSVLVFLGAAVLVNSAIHSRP